MLYTIPQHLTIKWMHMNVWHTVIQCTIILRLSLKDTCPHPNILPIRSLPEVYFWVFHPMHLSPFLIRLTWVFTFHHYSIFFLSFSISYTFHNLYPFFTQLWCNWMPQVERPLHSVAKSAVCCEVISQSFVCVCEISQALFSPAKWSLMLPDICAPTLLDLFFRYFCINFHSSPCNPPTIRFLREEWK